MTQRPLPLNGAVRRVDGSRRFFSFFAVCTYSYSIPTSPHRSPCSLTALRACCPSHAILDLSAAWDYFSLLTTFLPTSLQVPEPEVANSVSVCWSWVILWPLRVGNGAGSSHTMSYGCALSQFAGLLAEEGNSRPGGAASVIRCLALPLCLFLSCASAFHLCPFFFFNLLFFPPNDGEKNNKRTQIAEEQNEGSLESFDSFSSFLSSFSFFHFVKLGRVLGNLYLFRIADGGTNLR